MAKLIYRYFLLFGFLAATGLSCRIAAADARTSPISFELVGPLHLEDYLDPRKSCQSALLDDTTRFFPCEPDPYKQACWYIERKIRQAADTSEDRLKPMIELENRVLTERLALAHQRIGWPVEGASPVKSLKYYTELQSYLRGEHDEGRFPELIEVIKKVAQDLETQRAAVTKNVDKALEVFQQMLRKSGHLASVGLQLSKLLQCVSDPIIDLNTTRTNAWMAAAPHDPNTLQENIRETGASIELDYNAMKECTLLLSPKTWLQCARGTPYCFHVLFHELGHVINSCHFSKLALQANDEIKNSHFWQFGKRRILRAVTSQSLNLWHPLAEATSCLKQLSSPRFHHENGCSPKDPDTDDLEETVAKGKCDATSPYPSQWLEAEADLWAASALAESLRTPDFWKKGLPTREEKIRIVYESMAELCFNVYIESERIPQDNLKTNREQQAALSRAEEAKCDAKGAFVEPWDVHQEDSERLNRNYLRNSDLRRELGCAPDPRIPVTCSPNGGVELWWPR